MKFRDIKATVQYLKENVDLVEFVGHDVSLRQRGNRWIGACPFHQDTNPSFSILPPKDGSITKWGCHPCNLRGDLIDYVQLRNQCTIYEAVEMIVERTGIDISNFVRPPTESEALQDSQYQYLHYMARTFHEWLLASPEQVFFLEEERGLEHETLARFLIGYCPSVAAARATFGDDALRFVEPNERNWDNIFGGHVLIPQFDASGRVWGWYSRRLDGTPKYMSTSGGLAQNDISSRLYGLAQAKKLPDRDRTKIIIVEGFFDVMMAQQNKFPAVAVCSTSITDNHIQTLYAHAIRNAVVVFDGDSAGRKAMDELALRAHNIHELQLQFAILPGDPDEFIDQQGREAFQTVIDKAACSVELVIGNYCRTDLTSVTAKNNAYQECISYLSLLPRSSFILSLGIDSLVTHLSTERSWVVADLERKAEPPLASEIAEQSVLAEFILNPQAHTLFPHLKAEHFAFQIHGTFYALVTHVIASGGVITVDLIEHEIRTRNLGQAYLVLLRELPSKDRSNVDRYVTEIIDRSLRRSVHQLLSKAQADVYDLKSNVATSVSQAVETSTRLLSGDTSRQVVFSNAEAIKNFAQTFDQRQRNSDSIVGLNAGPRWRKLMGWTGGLQDGCVHIIGALSGVGKTNALLNIIHGITMHPEGSQAEGLFVSQEMSTDECTCRLLAIDSGVPFDNIYRGRLENEQQMNALRDSFIAMNHAKLTWMVGIKSVSEIAIQARTLKAQGKLDFIALDYIQLLDISGYPSHMTTTDRYGMASQELKDLADTLKVPVVAAVQLNRKAFEVAEPSGEHIGSAYKIYQDAHVAYFLTNREDGMLGQLEKNRNGASGQTTMLRKSYEPGLACLRIWESD